MDLNISKSWPSFDNLYFLKNGGTIRPLVKFLKNIIREMLREKNMKYILVKMLPTHFIDIWECRRPLSTLSTTDVCVSEPFKKCTIYLPDVQEAIFLNKTFHKLYKKINRIQ